MGQVQPKLNSPTCPFCFSHAVQDTLAVKEMAKGSRDLFHYVLCRDCSSTYNAEFPKNISEYYEDYYSFQETTLTLDQLWWKKALVNLYSRVIVRRGLAFLFRPFFRCPTPRQMRVLSPNLQAFLFLAAKSNARILDVGSGVGQFVNMMNRFGYDKSIGIDPFLDESLESPHVRRSDIQSVNGIYDVILFNHSLEHMTEPEAALKKCDDLLSPSGTVVIHIPNMHSAEFTRFKQDWCWMHAPYHFAIPSRRGINLMANRCGFKVVDAICTSRYDHYLYSDEYCRDICDRDMHSVRRALENGTFDEDRRLSLSQMAYSLNKALTGDWIAYYLTRH